MHPGSSLFRSITNFLSRIKRTRIHISGLNTNYAGPASVGYFVRDHSSLAIDRDSQNPLPAQTEQPQCFQQAYMNLVPDYHRDGGRAKQAVCFNVPTYSFENRMTSGRQAGEVGHSRSRDEPDLRLRGHSKDRDQPLSANLFQGGRNG